MIKTIQFLKIENEVNANLIISKFRQKFSDKFIDSYINNSSIYIELEANCFDLFTSDNVSIETFINLQNLEYDWKFETVNEIRKSKIMRKSK